MKIFGKFIISVFLVGTLSSCSSKADNEFIEVIEILRPKTGKLSDGMNYTGLTGGRSWWTFSGNKLTLEYTAMANGNVHRAIEEWKITDLKKVITPIEEWDPYFEDWDPEKEVVPLNEFEVTPRSFFRGKWSTADFYVRFKKVSEGEYVSNELKTADTLKYAIQFRIDWNSSASATWERYIDYDDERGEKLYKIFYDVDEKEYFSELNKWIKAKEEAETDSDGDGLSDLWEEYKSNTDPTNIDTDGDGVNDGDDFFPLDSSKFEEL